MKLVINLFRPGTQVSKNQDELSGLPYRADPVEDLDLASGGIVKVYEDRRGKTYPDMPWEPKAAFHAVSKYYK